MAQLGSAPVDAPCGAQQQAIAADDYRTRYSDAFGPNAPTGLRVGVYQHSSVARDIMVRVVTDLGGTAMPLARSDVFIPVDTEAVDPDSRAQLADWCNTHQLDALISTDGDADRPMVTDATGQIVPDDVLGALTVQMLGATMICTPVSSNTMIGQMPAFNTLHPTRICSPFVIAAMENVRASDPTARVVGYEANVGFLLGFDAQGPAGAIAPLMTRDCLLPMLAPLSLVMKSRRSLADLMAALPPRFTASDRLTGILTEASKPFLKTLSQEADFHKRLFAEMDEEESIDLTDGLRLTFADGEIVHLRQSDNAPEFRCYTEAESAARTRRADVLRNLQMHALSLTRLVRTSLVPRSERSDGPARDDVHVVRHDVEPARKDSAALGLKCVVLRRPCRIGRCILQPHKGRI